MPIERKISALLILRSLAAVLAGVAIVAVFVALLSLYGEQQEQSTPVTAKVMPFPENERMLKSMADQLAREGQALSTVEPAAGDKVPATPKD